MKNNSEQSGLKYSNNYSLEVDDLKKTIKNDLKKMQILVLN